MDSRVCLTPFFSRIVAVFNSWARHFGYLWFVVRQHNTSSAERGKRLLIWFDNVGRRRYSHYCSVENQRGLIPTGPPGGVIRFPFCLVHNQSQMSRLCNVDNYQAGWDVADQLKLALGQSKNWPWVAGRFQSSDRAKPFTWFFYRPSSTRNTLASYAVGWSWSVCAHTILTQTQGLLWFAFSANSMVFCSNDCWPWSWWITLKPRHRYFQKWFSRRLWWHGRSDKFFTSLFATIQCSSSHPWGCMRGFYYSTSKAQNNAAFN